MLTPEQIQMKMFKTTRLKEGYDLEEVDNFLDRVASDYKQLKAERDQALADNQRLRAKQADTQPTQVLTPVASPTETAERLLRVAEQTAQEHIADAQAKADEIVRDAGAKGAEAIEEADRAASDIKERAQREGDRLIEEAQRKVAEVTARKDQLAEHVAQLEEKRRTYKSWLKSTLALIETEDSRA